MVNKILVAISFGLMAILLVDFNKIYVPEDFERPFVFKGIALSFKYIASIARLNSALKFGDEPTLFRNYLSTLINIGALIQPKDQSHVKLFDTKLGNVPVRIYTPQTQNDDTILPVMIYFHGGAYVFGDINNYDDILIEISKSANIVVISVDYKMAPEYPFPKPLDDCYKVTLHVIGNHKELKINKQKIILAGDSAGGNAVALIAQRLALSNSVQAKLQVLIYPWTQVFNNRLPSAIQYNKKGFLSNAGFSFGQYILWVCGKAANISNELEQSIMTNQHIHLIEDENLKTKYQSYLDVSLIPEKYKRGKSYYDLNSSKSPYPSKINNIGLFNDDDLKKNLLKLISPEGSPALAEPEVLKLLPKAYFIILEWDTLKDEGLIYSERLRKSGVEVDVAFYENMFHGGVQLIDPILGYSISRQIINDLIIYIQNNI